MKHQKLIEHFFNQIETHQVDKVLTCFTSDGIVDSPFIGKVPAKEFFSQIFSKWDQAKVTTKDIYDSAQNENSAAALIIFELIGGENPSVTSEGIDSFIFKGDKIEMVRFFYDTKKAFEQLAS